MTYVCTQCGGLSRNNDKECYGSFGKELLLYVLALFGFAFFVIPGVIMLVVAIGYTYKRFTNKRSVCLTCGAENTKVPVDSPLGRDIAIKSGYEF